MARSRLSAAGTGSLSRQAHQIVGNFVRQAPCEHGVSFQRQTSMSMLPTYRAVQNDYRDTVRFECHEVVPFADCVESIEWSDGTATSVSPALCPRRDPYGRLMPLLREDTLEDLRAEAGGRFPGIELPVITVHGLELRDAVWVVERGAKDWIIRNTLNGRSRRVGPQFRGRTNWFARAQRMALERNRAIAARRAGQPQ